jgi:hypothetical protein
LILQKPKVWWVIIIVIYRLLVILILLVMILKLYYETIFLFWWISIFILDAKMFFGLYVAGTWNNIENSFPFTFTLAMSFYKLIQLTIFAYLINNFVILNSTHYLWLFHSLLFLILVLLLYLLELLSCKFIFFFILNLGLILILSSEHTGVILVNSFVYL